MKILYPPKSPPPLSAAIYTWPRLMQLEYKPPPTDRFAYHLLHLLRLSGHRMESTLFLSSITVAYTHGRLHDTSQTDS